MEMLNAVSLQDLRFYKKFTELKNKRLSATVFNKLQQTAQKL